MSNTFGKKPLALALGAAFAMNGLATQAGTLFQASDLSSGYLQLAEGKCGEGKCGGEMKTGAADAKAHEGKCGEAMFNKMDTNKDGKLGKDEFMAGHKAMEGKCGAGKCGDAAKTGTGAKAAEGKCGEGKCGEGKCGGSK